MDKSKTEKELIYSAQHSDFIKGRAYSNPRFFSTPRAGFDKVLIVGDYPNIEAAYKAMSVEVEVIGQAAAYAAPEKAGLAEGKALAPKLSDAERDAVQIPDDWRDMKWTGKGETLRSLAANFSAEPVLNKAQATAAIEAELARRAAVPMLTRAEINADLEGMGIEPDPTMSDEDALAVRNEARAKRDAAE